VIAWLRLSDFAIDPKSPSILISIPFHDAVTRVAILVTAAALPDIVWFNMMTTAEP